MKIDSVSEKKNSFQSAPENGAATELNISYQIQNISSLVHSARP
jgi:hypothetical protein